ncbi:Target of rapamycin complex 1 subunit kog1, partial [Linderina pennispora]
PDNGTEERAQLRAWILLSLAELWKNHSDAKWMAMTYRLCVIAATRQQQAQAQEQRRAAMGNGVEGSDSAHGSVPSFEELLAASVEDENVDSKDAQDLLIQMACHRSPLVRASALYAMNTLLSDLAHLGDDPGVLTIIRKVERQTYAALLHAAGDGSPMVRREMVNVVGSAVFASYMPQAVAAVGRVMGEEVRMLDRRAAGGSAGDGEAISMDLLVKLYKALLGLSADAHPDVALAAQQVCDTLMQCYVHSQQFLENEAVIDRALHQAELARVAGGQAPGLGFLTGNSSVGDALLGKPPRREPQTQQMHQMQQRRRRQSAAHGIQRVGGAGNAGHRYTMHGALGSPPGEAAGVVRDRFAGLTDGERVEAARRMVGIERAWLEWGRQELRSSVCESTLVDWAGAHFTEFDISLFATVAGRVQGSQALVESVEKSRRISRMEADARLMANNAAYAKWTDVAAVGGGSCGSASAALMHPVEPHVVVASRNGDVSVYDWEQSALVGRYAVGGDMRSLHLINPLAQARLVVGTDDGTVRVFSSHAPDFVPPASGGPAPEFPRPRLLTAFRAVPWASIELPLEAGRGKRPGSGLVTAWSQRAAVLLAGGATREVRVWDVATELCIEEVQISPVGGVTCLSHDHGLGNLFAVGNADGVVRVMDRRAPARQGSVANWREHAPHAVRSVTLRADQMHVVSAGENGDVSYWDLRHRESVFTLRATHPNRQLAHMLVHDAAPVTLTASDATVKLWNQRGSNIGVVTTQGAFASSDVYMKSLAGFRDHVRVDAVAMHPYLPMAAMVCDDGRVSVIRPRRTVPSLAGAKAHTVG